MSPDNTSPSLDRRCFPRVSGDEPPPLTLPTVRVEFSPRERG